MRIVAFAIGALLASATGLQAQAQPDSTALAESAVQERPALVPNSCQAPQYPMQLRQARVEGRVLLRFVVEADGRVDPTSVAVVSVTHSRFEGPARQAIATCRYRPARFNDRAVRVTVMAPVDFRLPRT
jgi:periplasmic protein TonB